MASEVAAKRAVREAQKAYERDLEESERQAEEAKAKRLRVFREAQEDGLTPQDIADATGLHHSRIGQILEGK